MGFYLIIGILILTILLSINIWKKSKRTRYRKIMVLIVLWIIVLLLELIFINIYFATQF